MKKLNIFLDSSALIAGVISETGADHALLQLGETEDILLTISELVFNETTRSIAKKSADNLEDIQKEIKRAKIKIIKDPSHGEVQANLYWIDDPDNVPILLAAGKTKKRTWKIPSPFFQPTNANDALSCVHQSQQCFVSF